MAKLQLVALLVALMLCLMQLMASADVCSDIAQKISSCQNYALGLVATPPPLCCSQVAKLNAQTKGNTPLRRQICSCFQGVIKALGVQRFTTLLSTCRINLGYTISASTKCNQIR